MQQQDPEQPKIKRKGKRQNGRVGTQRGEDMKVMNILDSFVFVFNRERVSVQGHFSLNW